MVKFCLTYSPNLKVQIKVQISRLRQSKERLCEIAEHWIVYYDPANHFIIPSNLLWAPRSPTFRIGTKPSSTISKLKLQHCAIFCTPFSTLVTPPLSEMIHLSLLSHFSSVLPDSKIWSLPFLGLCQGGGHWGAIQASERRGSNFAG